MEDTLQPAPLLLPAGGTPPIVNTEEALETAMSELRAGHGPFAVDAERASGYRYSARAYLIQIKRRDGGLHLIDPIPFGSNNSLIAQLNQLLNSDETILHASTQDLPCLREIGIDPIHLFDTELGARIAGLPRVGLGPLLESLLGVSLAKEHSAADWSTRPLPHEWLTYAALDVELLVELRDAIYAILESTGKLQWAKQEFASILKAPPPPPRLDPWRRTSGVHKIKRRDHLAIIRELWSARDHIASAQDIAGGKLLNDAAIIELCLAAPASKRELEKALRPIGVRARWVENSSLWLEAIARAVAMPESQWPEMRSSSDTLPPIKLWRDRFPEKFAPLSHARALIEIVATEHNIPVENLITPEFLRRICWSPPADSTALRNEAAVRERLLELGARPWQIDLVAGALADALLEREALIIPESVAKATDEAL